tara:strand:- start:532 stop:1176 length:645 start_codon:yes stop_codon:yes gene_type:complete
MQESPKAREIYSNLLKNLGHEDNTEMRPSSLFNKTIMYYLESGCAQVNYYLKNFYNKKSYIYPIFLETFHCQIRFPNKNHPQAGPTMKMLEIVNFTERRNIAEVGWEIVFDKQPMYFTMMERLRLLVKMRRETQRLVESAQDKTEMFGDFRPVAGDMLMEKPFGPKMDLGFSEQSIKLGSKQRENIAKGYGFGDIKEDGCQYGRFDEDMILHPV